MTRTESRQGGQATLEVALCLPLIALLMGGLVEIGLFVADHSRVWHAAREAVRVAAVDPDESKVLQAAQANGLKQVSVDIEPDPHARILGEPVTVDVEYRPTGRLPIIGRAVRALTIEADATMRIEQP